VFERAGPRLLGLDIASIASEESKQQIVGILDAPDLHDRLVMHMLRGESHYGDAVGEIENRLAEFRIGLMDWPGP
jgi:predicted nucleotidyltransferase